MAHFQLIKDKLEVEFEFKRFCRRTRPFPELQNVNSLILINNIINQYWKSYSNFKIYSAEKGLYYFFVDEQDNESNLLFCFSTKIKNKKNETIFILNEFIKQIKRKNKPFKAELAKTSRTRKLKKWLDSNLFSGIIEGENIIWH